MNSQRFWNLILQPATNFGYETDLWTVGRVHQVVQEKLKVIVSKDTIWRRLREAGLTYQKPERQYFETDDEARQEWLECTLPKVRETVRKYRAILYFQDEANVSLTAFLGKTWAPRGKTPKGQVTGKRGGVAAFLRSASRDTSCLLCTKSGSLRMKSFTSWLKCFVITASVTWLS